MKIKWKLIFLIFFAVITLLSVYSIIFYLIQDSHYRAEKAFNADQKVTKLFEINNTLTLRKELLAEQLLGIDKMRNIAISRRKTETLLTEIKNNELTRLCNEFSTEEKIILGLYFNGENEKALSDFRTFSSPAGLSVRLSEELLPSLIARESKIVTNNLSGRADKDRALMGIILAIMVLSRVGMLSTVMTLNKVIVQRLNNLNSAARSFFPGKEDLLSLSDKPDEIGELQNSMVDMMEKINRDTFQLDYVNSRVESILKVVDKTTSGDYYSRCRLSGKNDIFNNLSMGINHMIDDLVTGMNNIRKQHDWLNLTLSSIADAIIVTDLTMNITYLNRCAEELTGWNSPRAMGKDIDSVLVFIKELSDTVPLSVRKNSIRETGKAVVVSEKGKKTEIEYDIRDVTDAENSVWGKLIVFRDISEILDKNKKLAILQEKMIRNEKLSSIGLLAAGIAHEINNPIGYIKSNFRTLRKRLEKLEKAREIINTEIACEEKEEEINKLNLENVYRDIHEILEDNDKGINKIYQIVSGMKTVSVKKDDKTFETVNLNNIIEDVLKITENESKYVTKIFFNPPKKFEIECLPHQISQVFLNLILNAIHAVDHSVHKETQRIDIEIAEDSKFITCAVKDTGNGIPEEILPQIFDPFFTTKEPGEGTGLGLNVSYNIIRNHEGELSAHNDPEGGAVFTVKLPKTQSTQA